MRASALGPHAAFVALMLLGAGRAPAFAQVLPAPTPVAAPAPPLLVRGQVLSAGRGYLVFTTGDAVRIRPGTPLPPRAVAGSLVRVAIDTLDGAIVSVVYEPAAALPGEIDATNIPRQYVAVSPKSAPSAAPPALAVTRADTPAGAADGTFAITVAVRVPPNTPVGDDVYLATDRSNFNPSEIRMQRLDATDFSVSLALRAGTRLRYQFTRGSFATVERDRSGAIVDAHVLDVTRDVKTADVVVRWADKD